MADHRASEDIRLYKQRRWNELMQPGKEASLASGGSKGMYGDGTTQEIERLQATIARQNADYEELVRYRDELHRQIREYVKAKEEWFIPEIERLTRQLQRRQPVRALARWLLRR